MNNLLTKYKIQVVFILALFLGLAAGRLLLSERLQSIELQATTLVNEQRATLATIAETTARNGADSTTESIIRDCSLTDRNRYNELLNDLNLGLPRAALVELDGLHALCGPFYTERKALMVSRLEREIEIYTKQVDFLSTITGSDLSQEYQVDLWQQLAEGEQNQTVLFGQLVRHQKSIIDALIAGNTATSPEITDILVQVTETNQNLELAVVKNRNLREQLTDL